MAARRHLPRPRQDLSDTTTNKAEFAYWLVDSKFNYESQQPHKKKCVVIRRSGINAVNARIDREISIVNNII